MEEQRPKINGWKLTAVIALAALAVLIVICVIIGTKGAAIRSASPDSTRVTDGSLSHEGYHLEQVLILSRHNIRSPLVGGGSLLDTITPYEWFAWTSGPSELSLRGGVLETEMGQYFRKWMESEGLIPENYRPESGEVRFYSNSKQRTIATAQYFATGMLPVADPEIEHHAEYDQMDPVFSPSLTFCSDEYADDVTRQIETLYGERLTSLADNYTLLSDVIDMSESEGFISGDITSFDTSDYELKMSVDQEPGVSGSIKTACSVSDALVLQYYEAADTRSAGFGRELTYKEWEAIAEIKDVYEDILFTAPLVAPNVAHPLLEEMRSEMDEDSRVFTFLCGHDSNVASVLAALGAKEYELPGAIEKKTPIGCKLVWAEWTNDAGEKFWSVDIVYQNTEQLRGTPILSGNEAPEIFDIEFEGIEKNPDGLYSDTDIRRIFDNALDEYYRLYDEYADEEALDDAA